MSLLVKDSKPGAWWVYDGVDHMLWAVLPALIARVYFYGWPYWLIAFGTVAFFFTLEVKQEKAMADRRKAYPYNPFKWSQNRWQDFVLPVVPFIILKLL